MSAAPPWWGYHRLRDNPARTLVRLSGAGPGVLVLDLGAGTGAITRLLLGTGATVVAVELHPGRAAGLRRRYHDGRRCRVVETDLAMFRFPRRPFQVVANPPFGQLATLLRRMTTPHSGLVRADLVVPLPLAARVARGAHPVCRRYAGSISHRFAADAFAPAAPGPAAVLTLIRRR